MFQAFYAKYLQRHMRPPVLGAAFGLFIVLSSIIVSAHGFLAFFSLEGLLIVGGGVIAVAFMSYDTANVHRALHAIAALLKEPTTPPYDLQHDMRYIISLSHIIREKGLRVLETLVSKSNISDPFLKYGLNMIASDYAPTDIRAMMETAADATFDRENIPADILDSMTSHAPAFGMVGTLVGMVSLLQGLDASALSSIGASLSVAFLSTLYGVLSARMIYMPAAAKLRHETNARRFRDQLIVEGMVLLASNKQPMFINDRLNSFLRAEKRDYYNIFARPRAAAPKPYLKVV